MTEQTQSSDLHAIAQQQLKLLRERYADIIPNMRALAICLQQPLPQTAWVNPTRINRDDLLSSLKQSTIQALRWNRLGFRCDPATSLGKTWQYAAGLLHIQEEVSMLPVYALDMQPSDCVLDMCAAPGNKTAQMAVLMQNEGTVVANDVRYERLRALGQTLKRLGLMNVNIHVGDGRQLATQQAPFNKILVDAPCSCEGTLRKSQGRIVLSSAAKSHYMATTQIALLKRAIALLQPGGRLLYSTCTFAPEENECVIDTILQQYGDQIALVPIEIPHFNASPGITQWCGRQLSSTLKHSWRIWPHLNNSGGFYMALLVKRGRTTLSTASKPMTSTPATMVQSHIADRFGINVKQLPYHYLQSSQRGIYATMRTNLAVSKDFLPSWQFDARGCFFLKTKIRYPKLTTAAALIVGAKAQAHVVMLTACQRDRYLNKQDVQVAPEQRLGCVSTGYVIVKYDKYVLGVGLIFARDIDLAWPLRSLIPRYW